MPTSSVRRSQKSSAPSSFSRNRRVRRQFTVESLESRTLLTGTYAITWTSVNAATVNESGGSDSFKVIEAVVGGVNVLEYNANNTGYMSVWGTGVGTSGPVNASAATTVTINLTGDNSLIQLGDPTAVLPSAASANLATFDVSTA
ncbi:MAG: hypothetical protein ACLP53_18000, partial [Isosphaeraceae bacterium]